LPLSFLSSVPAPNRPIGRRSRGPRCRTKRAVGTTSGRTPAGLSLYPIHVTVARQNDGCKKIYSNVWKGAGNILQSGEQSHNEKADLHGSAFSLFVLVDRTESSNERGHYWAVSNFIIWCPTLLFSVKLYSFPTTSSVTSSDATPPSPTWPNCAACRRRCRAPARCGTPAIAAPPRAGSATADHSVPAA
jgi:hypothetical protein